MLATGKIRKYQIIMSALYFGSFLLCYVFFKCGLGPEFGYISTIIAVFLGLFARLFLLREIIPSFSIKQYVCGAIVKSGLVIIASTLGSWGVSRLFMSNSFLEFIGVCLCSIILVPVLSFLFALDNSEKSIVKKYLYKVKSSILPQIH